MHKDLSISSYHESIVAVGATHIKEKKVTNLEQQAKDDSHKLLIKAQKLLPMRNLTILKTYIGYRNSTLDYFPIVGKLIDYAQTIKNYPSIKKGTKIPTKNYAYLPNFYIHGALGSRGFVYAPYNAEILTKLIVDDKEIDERLSPIRLFKKWTRKA
jgi:glycine/D-amino acid oxidase-like deaminating enzyme